MPSPLLFGFAIFSAVVSFIGAPGHAGRQPEPEASSVRCPMIYAPVICDGGKIYSNLCIAEAHHAKNCVPYGAL